MHPKDKFDGIKHKRWELRRAILEIIFLAILSGGGSPTRPSAPVFINAIIQILKEQKKLNVEEKKVRRVLESLEKREIIMLAGQGDNVFVKSIDNKNPAVIKYSIKALLDFKRKKKEWKGKWYFVFFDVPEVQRNKREYLRKFLVKLGFYPYQKSVYLFPYECEEEISLIKKIVEGAKYMKYIVAEKIEDEDAAKRFFNI